MPRLTLRTLLAYIDDTLGPVETRSLGRKVLASEDARELVERIKKVTRRRGLKTPVSTHADDETADPNTVAEYLDNTLDSPTLKQVEETCLGSDVHLAEVAACHQILTLVLTEPVRVPPRAHRRMYGLQPAPAATPGRRPNKTLPVGGVRLPDPAQAEHDEADAALLLGMKRYSAATPWAARLALIGVGVALVLFLAGAVFMALPHRTLPPPETTPGNSFAQLPAPEVVAPRPKEPDPVAPKPKDPVVVAPKPKEPDIATALAMASAVIGEIAATKPVDPGPALADPVAAPDPKVREIGRVETHPTLVVTQLDPERPGVWSRIRLKPEDDEPVRSNLPVMALPGYKANLTLYGDANRNVQVVLWGNVPEQLPYRVFESRVKFHPPPTGFDADLTLLGGRIYLKSKKTEGDKKPADRKVRVRVAGEVWDITLPDEKAEVLVELVSWFEPGTTYARKDGTPPKLEGRVAVVTGTAGVAAPRRFRKYEAVAAERQLLWDSGSGGLSEPRPIGNMQDSTPTPLLEADFQKKIARILADAADKAADRAVARQVMEARIDPPPNTPDRDFVARLAIYSLAAMTDSTAAADMLKPLVDILKSEVPWLARQAVVTALTAWVARDRANTAVLRAVLVGKGLGEDKELEDDADRLLRLLRGFVSASKPDPDRLDDLMTWLTDRPVPVREAALWQVTAVEQEAWVPAPVDVNVGIGVNTDGYRAFLGVTRMKIDALKKRPIPVPLPRPVRK